MNVTPISNYPSIHFSNPNDLSLPKDPTTLVIRVLHGNNLSEPPASTITSEVSPIYNDFSFADDPDIPRVIAPLHGDDLSEPPASTIISEVSQKQPDNDLSFIEPPVSTYVEKKESLSKKIGLLLAAILTIAFFILVPVGIDRHWLNVDAQL